MLASITTNLGAHAIFSGDFDAAFRHSLEAMELFRALGRPNGIAVAASKCGWASLALGDDARAGEWFREAVDVAHEVAHRFVVRACALGLAAVAVSGAHERAARPLGTEHRTRDEMGIQLDEHEEAVRRRAADAARAALGENALATTCARGAALTDDEIVALCRGTSSPDLTVSRRRPRPSGRIA